MSKPRGRPKEAAQTVDEALAALAAGTAPKRPRNEIERMVGAKRLGRKPNYAIPVYQAAMLAKYRIDEGIDKAQAVREAAQVWGMTLANVRTYLKKLGPKTVTVGYNGPGPGADAWARTVAQNMPPRTVPFCTVEDVE